MPLQAGPAQLLLSARGFCKQKIANRTDILTYLRLFNAHTAPVLPVVAKAFGQ